MDDTKIMFKPGLMKGTRTLVTGGGSGLGKEMAEALLYLGGDVVICGRRGDMLKETADELMGKHGANGGKVIPIPCDIRVPEAIRDMNDRIWSEQGALTGLINNAAGNFISRTEDLSPRGFDAIANIVFHGTFYMTSDIGKRWIADKRPGSVISILTTWVWNGGPFTVPSAMSKAGVNIMMQSLAVEWGKHNIRFNSIAPGPFPTEGAWARLNPTSGGAEESTSRRTNPMGRVGHMHELCNLAVLLLGPGAEYINGQCIAIDGGAYQAGGGGFAGLMEWSDEQWAAARNAIQDQNAKDRAKRTV